MPRTLKDFFLTACSAVLLVLPFDFGWLWPLALIAFIPYFFVIRKKSRAEAFKISFIFGFIFHLVLSFWVGLVSVPGMVIAAAYLAVYFALFGNFISPFLESPKILRTLLFVPSFWVLLEFTRGFVFGGLPWALVGYSQWKNIPFIQIAELTGVYGVSFFVLLVNVILFKWVQDRARRGAPLLAGILAAAVILVGGYGWLTLRSRDAFIKGNSGKPMLRVSVLQGNVPQDQKWDARIKNIIFEKYKRLSTMSAIEKSDLIVWPETSFPGYLEDEPLMSAQLRALIRQCRTEVLVGAPTMGNLEEGLRFYNSAILYGPDGEEKMRYNKLHLVPFGEFVPLEPIFGFTRMFGLIGRFSAGDTHTVFQTQSRAQNPNIKSKFSVLICFEDIFPGLVRNFCRNGADFLINITNDAWFGKTIAPYLHAQGSIFRAVENRVWVVRATNTGLSCFISPEGRIVDSVQDNGEEIFVTGRKAHDLLLRKTPTFYTHFGDVFVLACFALTCLAFRSRLKENAYSF